MAQPNVVREPSMDEILASIRRIIESNDPVPSGIANSMPEPEGFAGNAANDDMEDVPLTIDDAFAAMSDAAPVYSSPSHAAAPRYEQIEPMSEARRRAAQEAEDAAHHPVAARAPEPAPQTKSLSLADVAARVRAASERNPGLRDLASKPVDEETAPAATATATVMPEAPATSPLMTGRMAAAGGMAAQVERPPVAWNQIAPRVEQRAVAEEPAAPREELGAMITTPVSQPTASDETALPASLISLDAGQQVARSFQDLAVAVDQAERRSYDEIAADLLRPMLQEWLDENLPTLVERLVREEIERVARGNRR